MTRCESYPICFYCTKNGIVRCRSFLTCCYCCCESCLPHDDVGNRRWSNPSMSKREEDYARASTTSQVAAPNVSKSLNSLPSAAGIEEGGGAKGDDASSPPQRVRQSSFQKLSKTWKVLTCCGISIGVMAILSIFVFVVARACLKYFVDGVNILN